MLDSKLVNMLQHPFRMIIIIFATVNCPTLCVAQASSSPGSESPDAIYSRQNLTGQLEDELVQPFDGFLNFSKSPNRNLQVSNGFGAFKSSNQLDALLTSIIVLAPFKFQTTLGNVSVFQTENTKFYFSKLVAVLSYESLYSFNSVNSQASVSSLLLLKSSLSSDSCLDDYSCGERLITTEGSAKSLAKRSSDGLISAALTENNPALHAFSSLIDGRDRGGVSIAFPPVVWDTPLQLSTVSQATQTDVAQVDTPQVDKNVVSSDQGSVESQNLQPVPQAQQVPGGPSQGSTSSNSGQSVATPKPFSFTGTEALLPSDTFQIDTIEHIYSACGVTVVPQGGESWACDPIGQFF